MSDVQADTDLDWAIQEARTGGDQELGLVLDHFRPMLLRTAKQRLGPEVSVRVAGSDLVQETMLSAVRNFRAFRGTTAEQLQRWLLRILQARLTDGLRRHCFAERRRLAGEERSNLKRCAAEIESPSKLASLGEQAGALYRAMAKLEAVDRHLLVLRYAEQLSFESIAQQLQLPRHSVCRRWRRTIKELKCQLEKEGF
jgi:RNA polymerase sigma-70 factor, ECF subfamily